MVRIGWYLLIVAISTFPLAASAQSCGLRKRFTIVQDNGYRISVKLTRGGTGGSDTTGHARGNGGLRGVIKDVLIEGRNVRFSIAWQGGPTGRYTGVIQRTSSDATKQWGVVRGTTVDVNQPQSQANWYTEEPFTCSRN
jgi:hypothetical protein